MRTKIQLVFHILLVSSLILFISTLVDHAAKAEEMEYRLGPGDVLRITVWEEDDLTGEFKVSPAGTIDYPLLESVEVKGKTTLEITEEITRRLKKDYLHRPRVQVTVKEYLSQVVYILGEVERPGARVLKGPTRLSTILFEAGGTTKMAGETLTVFHPYTGAGKKGNPGGKHEGIIEEKVISTDKVKKLDPRHNIWLAGGDIITVSSRKETSGEKQGSNAEDRFFRVMGEVKRQGRFELKPGFTILDGILQAGGFTDYAKQDRVKLIRRTPDREEVHILDLEAIVEEEALEKNIPLVSGDTIVVPGSLF